MAAGERDLVIRRGKIIQQKPKPRGEDHAYVTPLRDRPAAAETGGVRFSDRSRSPPWQQPAWWLFSLMTETQKLLHVYTLTIRLVR